MHFTALLIEPPGIDSQLLKLMLAPEKFRVQSAECGQQAWNLILESAPPDLVIIDTDLPLNGSIRIDAAQLMNLMREQPDWEHVPKILLTSENTPRIMRFTNDPSIEAAILKPYDPRRFMQEVCDSQRKMLQKHIEEVNRQHLELGALLQDAIKQVERQSTAHIGPTLNQLISTIQKHFAFEEQFMSKHSYPDLIEHQKNHRQLLDRADVLITQHLKRQTAMTVDKLEKLRKALFEDLSDDKKYIQFLQELRTSLLATSSQNTAIN